MRNTLSLISAALVLLTTTTTLAEPGVDEVREVALRHAGLHGRADRWSARARLRHLLPRLSADAGTSEQLDDNVRYDEWLTRDANEELLWDSARNQNDDNRRVRTDLTIRATIELGGLLFDEQELDASREARARHEARLKLSELVHEAYFLRLGLLDALRATPATDADRRRALGRELLAAEARLDALTGGWYAAELRRTP